MKLFKKKKVLKSYMQYPKSIYHADIYKCANALIQAARSGDMSEREWLDYCEGWDKTTSIAIAKYSPFKQFIDFYVDVNCTNRAQQSSVAAFHSDSEDQLSRVTPFFWYEIWLAYGFIYEVESSRIVRDHNDIFLEQVPATYNFTEKGLEFLRKCYKPRSH